MARRAIVLGDATTHGGVVVSASSLMSVDGKPIAVMGDLTTCPKCKGTFAIVEGTSKGSWMGKMIALDGMMTSCDAFLIASQSKVVFDDDTNQKHNKSLSATSNPVSYDEMLRLVDESGVVLSGLEYTVKLADGTTRRGITDSEGCTERIFSDKPVAITEIEIPAEEGLENCCSVAMGSSGKSSTYKEVIEGVMTNTAKNSIKSYEFRIGFARRLTEGEKLLARSIFKDSIDYEQVKIYKSGHIVTPERGMATAPMGTIYFHRDDFRDDFSVENQNSKRWFIHEMTHIWQYHQGYNLVYNGGKIMYHGGYKNRAAYNYSKFLNKYTKFSDFNMEQQADMVAEYFILKSTVSDVRIQKILQDFIRNPKNAALLPTTTDF